MAPCNALKWEGVNWRRDSWDFKCEIGHLRLAILKCFLSTVLWAREFGNLTFQMYTGRLDILKS